jgi:hypothetical protein
VSQYAQRHSNFASFLDDLIVKKKIAFSQLDTLKPETPEEKECWISYTKRERTASTIGRSNSQSSIPGTAIVAPVLVPDVIPSIQPTPPKAKASKEVPLHPCIHHYSPLIKQWWSTIKE